MRISVNRSGKMKFVFIGLIMLMSIVGSRSGRMICVMNVVVRIVVMMCRWWILVWMKGWLVVVFCNILISGSSVLVISIRISRIIVIIVGVMLGVCRLIVLGLMWIVLNMLGEI